MMHWSCRNCHSFLHSRDPYCSSRCQTEYRQRKKTWRSVFVPGVTVRERRSGDIGTLLQIGPSADHPHAGPENLIVRVEQSRLSLGYFVYDLHWTHFDPLEGAAEPEGASAKPGEESERQG